MKSNPHLTILTIVFGLLTLYLIIRVDEILYLIFVLSLLSILSIKFSKIIEGVWFGIALVLSQIVPNILLAIIFYLILTPLSILSKLFKANTDFQSINDKKTFFKNRFHEFKKESFRKTW